MSTGVNARELSDDDLRHDLAQLKGKAADIESGGTPHQQANHRERTDELEAEFLRRHPEPGSDGPTSSADAESGDARPPADPGQPDPDDSAAASTADADTAPPVADEPSDDPAQPTNPA